MKSKSKKQFQHEMELTFPCNRSNTLLLLNSRSMPSIWALVLFLLTLPESELAWGVHITLITYMKSSINWKPQVIKDTLGWAGASLTRIWVIASASQCKTLHYSCTDSFFKIWPHTGSQGLFRYWFFHPTSSHFLFFISISSVNLISGFSISSSKSFVKNAK